MHVLLAACNGELFLERQWRSLEAQANVSIVLHVADDDSRDGTVALLRRLSSSPAGAISEVRWLEAPPRHSHAGSFLTLLRHAFNTAPDAVWFAYCDQDDIWLPEKLAVAIASLSDIAPYLPALYGGRTLLVTEDENPIGRSRYFPRAPSFRNALVQSVAGGNTMVMNRAAAQAVTALGVPNIKAHDWWTGQIVMGVGGVMRYDPTPHIWYRQHARNQVGSNRGLTAALRRVQRLGRGDFRNWTARTLRALQPVEHRLTPENQQVLRDFELARSSPALRDRLRHMYRSGVFRQSFPQQLLLWLACAMKRL